MRYFLLATLGLLFCGSISAQSKARHHLTPQNVEQWNKNQGKDALKFIESRPYIFFDDLVKYGQLYFQRSEPGEIEAVGQDGSLVKVEVVVDLFLWNGPSDVSRCLTIWYMPDGRIQRIWINSSEQCEKFANCNCII